MRAIPNARYEQDAVVVRRVVEGSERIPFLSLAEFISVAPGGEEGDEPPYVFIGWGSENVERPLAGTLIWRAALEWFLERRHPADAADAAIDASVRRALDRFPSLESWLQWSDHERPPVPDRPRPQGTKARSSLPLLPWSW